MSVKPEMLKFPGPHPSKIQHTDYASPHFGDPNDWAAG